MPTELENRFIVGDEECKYITDSTPQYGSEAFVTSGAAYEWFSSLADYADRTIATESSQFIQNSPNIPTVGLVYAKLKALEDRVAALENS